VKNLNSLRSLSRAIEFEAERQIALITSGERVIQETRHFDENLGATSSMRSKEEANDYRYFPEPDLVLLHPDAAFIERVRESIGMLPAQRRQRLSLLVEPSDLSPSLSDQVATAVDLGLDDLVVHAVELGANPRLALARTANEAARHPEQARALDPSFFAALIELESSGKISATQAKVVLDELCATGHDPREIATRLGFEALGDDALEGVIDAVIASSPAEWTRYLAGDEKIAQFLLGKVMKETQGKANGKVVAESFSRRRGAPLS
jgi:aspartyl-tRNA(Asn)/glutamyl-tRNA(Gln) amidotransferase subunit B